MLVALALALCTAVVGPPASAPVSDAPTDTAIPVQTPSPSPSPPPSRSRTPNAERDPATVAAELFADGRYAEAAAAFEAAYRDTNDPAFLFGHAQALRFGGNCGGAIELFEAFIATAPPEPDVQEAERVIEACREILARGPARDPVAPPDEPTVAPPPPSAPTFAPPSWPRDPAGAALVGTGLALAATGGALFGASHALARDRVETESRYERRERNVQALSAAGLTTLAVGGALLIGGIVRWAVVARRDRTTTARADELLRWRF